MTKLFRLKTVMLGIVVLLILCKQSRAEEFGCTSPYKGQTISENELKTILLNKTSVPLNLCGTTLIGAQLNDSDLKNINLSGADVTNANLKNSNLSNANLIQTFLQSTDLTGSTLEYANLSRAILEYAILDKANLGNANLTQAVLKYAQLPNASLVSADLTAANLSFANLENANLSNVNLRGADLTGANLTNAKLINADLQDANLEGASLVGTNFDQAKLKNVNFANADLKNAIYQPRLGFQPDLISLLSTQNFDAINFQNFEHSLGALIELRNSYISLGIRKMEYLITATVKYNEMVDGWQQGGWRRVESVFSYVLFYITCDFGLQPVRPLNILLISIFIFLIPYRFALSWPTRHAGITIYWLPKRFVKWGGVKEYEPYAVLYSKLLNYHFIIRKKHWFKKQVNLLTLALFFSLLSAFSKGWKEINVSNWIANLQNREFTLKGGGWVRTIAGFQALFSAYLMVLWLLCTFGRPFEW